MAATKMDATTTDATTTDVTATDTAVLDASTDDEAAPKKSRRTLKIVAAILAVLVIAGAVITVIAVRSAMDSAAATTQVLRFDVAYRDTDCDLFEAVTTQEVRDFALGRPYDCNLWQSAAEGLTVDGDYTYSVKIETVSIAGDTATITTLEGYKDIDGAVQTIPFTYTLIRTDAGWIISEYANS
jgi:hypothetical protein